MAAKMHCENGVCTLVRPPRNDLHSWRRWKGVFAMIVSVVALFMLDMATSRLRYHYLLVSTLSPVKAEVQSSIYNYHGEIPAELQECKAFDRDTKQYIHSCSLSACEQNAIMLSQRRQNILHSVREAHPLSRWVSELFDDARGMDQFNKIERLFARKTCEGVISSSDKTNVYMDLCALGTFILSLFALWWSIRVFRARVKLD